MAIMSLLDHRALHIRHLRDTLRILGKLLVHPRHVKLGAFVTFCLLACRMTGLDGWKVLACLYERGPWLGALGVAPSIFTALPVAFMGFLHLLVHLLVPMLLIFTMARSVLVMVIFIMVVMVVPVLVMLVISIMVSMVVLISVAVVERRALVVASVVAGCAGLVTSVGLQNHRALLICLLDKALRVLVKLLVHPISVEFGALVTLRFLACRVAHLDGWKVLACLYEWCPWLGALGVTCRVGTALPAACMGFSHLLVHLVVPMLMMVTIAFILVSIFMEMLMCLPEAYQLHNF